MNAENFNLAALLQMAHSPVHNYAIPGLTSSLIGEPSQHGTMRLFECERDHQEEIIPHSHRFDFQCWVLKGTVRNRVWHCDCAYPFGDLFMLSRLTFGGECGKYERSELGVARYRYSDRDYTEGQCYSMVAREIHSIHFSRGAVVLFFEGRTVADSSLILEPWIDGKTVPTFKVEPWMFKRTDAEQGREFA